MTRKIPLWNKATDLRRLGFKRVDDIVNRGFYELQYFVLYTKCVASLPYSSRTTASWLQSRLRSYFVELADAFVKIMRNLHEFGLNLLLCHVALVVETSSCRGHVKYNSSGAKRLKYCKKLTVVCSTVSQRRAKDYFFQNPY